MNLRKSSLVICWCNGRIGSGKTWLNINAAGRHHENQKAERTAPPALRVSTILFGLPLALADAPLDLALDQVAFERAEVADKQLAVQVIGLV